MKWCHFLSCTMPGQTTFSTKFGFLIAKNYLDIELLIVFSDDSAYFLILRNVRQVTRQASQNQNSVHSKTSTRYTCTYALFPLSVPILFFWFSSILAFSWLSSRPTTFSTTCMTRRACSCSAEYSRTSALSSSMGASRNLQGRRGLPIRSAEEKTTRKITYFAKNSWLLGNSSNSLKKVSAMPPLGRPPT